MLLSLGKQGFLWGNTNPHRCPLPYPMTWHAGFRCLTPTLLFPGCHSGAEDDSIRWVRVGTGGREPVLERCGGRRRCDHAWANAPNSRQYMLHCLVGLNLQDKCQGVNHRALQTWGPPTEYGILCNSTGDTRTKLALNNNTYVWCLKCSKYSKMSVTIIIFTKHSTWKFSSAQSLGTNSETGTNLVALTLSTVLWSIDFVRGTTLGTEQVTQSGHSLNRKRGNYKRNMNQSNEGQVRIQREL